MGTIQRLQIPTDEQALLAKRTQTSEACYESIRKGGQSLRVLPHALLRAFEVEAWKQRNTPNGAIIESKDFMEWITAPYPRGLESDLDTVKAILVSSPDKEEATKALLLFDEALRSGSMPGRRNDLVDNINKVERPDGTSKQQGLRRLSKAAEGGDEEAVINLREVLEGRKSVNRACVDMGWRPARIDPDIRDRAATALAERIVCNFPADELDAAKADAFASGAKALGIALSNLIGESR